MFTIMDEYVVESLENGEDQDIGDPFVDALVAVGIGPYGIVLGFFNNPAFWITDEFDSYWDVKGWDEEPGLYRVKASIVTHHDEWTGDYDSWLDFEKPELLIEADPLMITDAEKLKETLSALTKG